MNDSQQVVKLRTDDRATASSSHLQWRFLRLLVLHCVTVMLVGVATPITSSVLLRRN